MEQIHKKMQYLNKTNTDKIVKKIIKNKTKINIKTTTLKHIQQINKKYRKTNNPTDILTFKNRIDKKKHIVDIILCFKIIKKPQKINLEKVIIHGILHSLKYKHSKMKEYKIMKKIQIKIGMSGIEPPTITTSK